MDILKGRQISNVNWKNNQLNFSRLPWHASGDFLFAYFLFATHSRNYTLLTSGNVKFRANIRYYKNRLAIKWRSNRRDLPAWRVNETSENSSSENTDTCIFEHCREASHHLVPIWHLRGVCGKLHRDLSIRTLVVVQVLYSWISHTKKSIIYVTYTIVFSYVIFFENKAPGT